MTQRSATWIGFSAILMWSFLALLSKMAGPVPPLQLAAMTFAIGGLIGVLRVMQTPAGFSVMRQPVGAWIVGAGGLSIYHAAYFYAIQTAPAAEVSLIAYLWPLLIVVFAAFLPNERLLPRHIIGVVLGMFGAVVIITKGFTVGIGSSLLTGHIVAFACAFIWSGYSVLSRKYAAVPTEVVAGYCLLTALVCFGLHLAFEETVWPTGATAWSAVILLGLLPVGLAFYTWDMGCKRGDIMLLGTLSYAAPLFSVIVLIAAGYADFHWSVLAACGLIIGGALIASGRIEKS